MESNNEIIIRKVDRSDLPKLIKLYEDVWPDVSYDKDGKARFVLEESTGINYCGELNGEIVGSRTSFFLNFYNGSNKLKCIQVGDSCTRKDCRGKGLFGKMNKALLADFFGEAGGELIWNISEEASKRVYERLGWNYIESLGTLVQFTRPFHIFAKVGHHIGVVGGNDGWEAGDKSLEIPKNFLQARESVMQMSNVLHVNYDQQTLDWRIKTNSGIKCFVDDNAGAVIYKLRYSDGLTIVLIGEMFPVEYSQKAFNKLLNVFKKSVKPDAIKCIISLGHPLYKFYRWKCFLPNFGRKFLNHGVRVEIDEMKQICYEPMNWAITMLDVDTF